MVVNPTFSCQRAPHALEFFEGSRWAERARGRVKGVVDCCLRRNFAHLSGVSV